MSSKRKEKKIKGTDTVPLPPPTETANFSYTPQKYSKYQRCRHSQSPGKWLSKHPPPPHQQILSIVGGNGSGCLNGIDHNSFMVRGITWSSSSKLKENNSNNNNTKHSGYSPRFFQVESDLRSSARNRQILLIPTYKEPTSNLAQTSYVHAGSTAPQVLSTAFPF